MKNNMLAQIKMAEAKYILILLFAGILLVSSCRELDVPVVDDKEEIQNYLVQEEDAQGLFRINGLFDTISYSLPGSDAIYYDTLLSSKRTYDIQISQEEVDYGTLGMFKEALAIVTDVISVKTVKVEGTEIVETVHNRQLKRYGIFLKLGDDYDKYVGWLLWGFRGYYANPSGITITTAGGSYPADSRLYTETLKSVGNDSIKWVQIRNFPIVAPNGSVKVKIGTRNFPILTAIKDTSYYTSALQFVETDSYSGSFKLPPVYDRLFDIALVQFIRDSTGVPAALPVFISFQVAH